MLHLVENELASRIRVADKAILQTSYLTDRQLAAFESVEFVQANLANDASVDKAFAGDDPFDYVINCAAMTKFGQGEAVYREHVLEVTKKCAIKAKEKGCKRFVEVSTAQVYDAGKVSKPK